MDGVIIFIAKYFYLIVILLAIAGALLLTKREKYDLLKLSVLAFPLSFLTAKILSKFIYDPRPFVLLHVHPLISHAADNGFPSDHTLLTATIAAVIFLHNRNLGILLFSLAIAIGEARVLALVHHQIDILGALLIGIGTVYLSKTVLIKFYSKKKLIDEISD